MCTYQRNIVRLSENQCTLLRENRVCLSENPKNLYMYQGENMYTYQWKQCTFLRENSIHVNFVKIFKIYSVENAETFMSTFNFFCMLTLFLLKSAENCNLWLQEYQFDSTNNKASIFRIRLPVFQCVYGIPFVQRMLINCFFSSLSDNTQRVRDETPSYTIRT